MGVFQKGQVSAPSDPGQGQVTPFDTREGHVSLSAPREGQVTPSDYGHGQVTPFGSPPGACNSRGSMRRARIVPV